MPRLIPAISETEPALMPDEAREWLGGVTRQTLDNYVRVGRGGRRLLARKVGGRVFFLASDLRAFVDPIQEQQPQQPTPRLRQRRGKISPETLRQLRQQGFKI